MALPVDLSAVSAVCLAGQWHDIRKNTLSAEPFLPLVGGSEAPVEDGFTCIAEDGTVLHGRVAALQAVRAEAPPKPRPAWCEACDHPDTRMIEEESGLLVPCPDCNPNRAAWDQRRSEQAAAVAERRRVEAIISQRSRPKASQPQD